MEENKTKIKKDLFRAIRGLKGNSKNRGITLVALVITIIVLLILAGITIAQLTGTGGLLNKVLEAKDNTKYANALEKINLAISASYGSNTEIDDNLLLINLNNIQGIKNKLTSIVYPVKINIDGYDFQINSNGQVSEIEKKFPEVKINVDYQNLEIQVFVVKQGDEIKKVILNKNENTEGEMEKVSEVLYKKSIQNSGKYEIVIETQYEKKSFSIDVYKIEMLDYPIITKDGVFNTIIYDNQGDIVTYTLNTNTTYSSSEYVTTSGYNNDLSNYDTVNNQTKIIKVDSSVWGKDIVVNLISRSGSANAGWWNYIYFYNKTTNTTTEYANFKTESTVTWTDKIITIPEGTTEIRFKAAAYYFQIKDIYTNNKPIINNELNQYPQITNYGVKTGYSILNVKYDESSTIKLYKINNNEWEIYQEKIKLTFGDILYTKGLNEMGIETRISQYTLLPNDSLKVQAYNSDLSNYDTVNNQTKKLEVDSSVWGKDIVVNLISKSGSANAGWWNYIYFYNKTTNTTTEYANFKTESTITWTDRIITVPEGTTEIRFKAAAYYFQIKDIDIYDTPKIKYYDYPIISDNSVSLKIYCTISYFDTSVKKLYKINDGEWNEYKENEIIELNENDTLYAKGIDMNETETYSISKYVAIKASDALGTNAYNNQLSDYEHISRTTKKIKVDSTAWRKDIVVNLISKSGSANAGWWNYIYFYNEATNTTTEYASFKTESTVTWTDKVITIPEGTTEIRFQAAAYYFQIKNIKIN